MPLQYIADYSGKTTAVVIPIGEWENIVGKHADLKQLNPPNATEKHIPLMKEFAGLLTKEQGETLLQHVNQGRDEWDTQSI